MRFIFSAVALCVAALSLPTAAQTIFPLNRAEILAGSHFDFKVEFAGLVDPAQVKVTINGQEYPKVLGQAAELIAREDGKDFSSLLLRDAAINKPGRYLVTASDGTNSKSVTWNVYATPSRRAAKNVILFIGDGFSIGHRTAARILSKGIEDGKYKGKLAMDEMPYMALLSTEGTDSIITNSEIEDATPAAMVAHTRRRSDYNDIVKMFYESKIDVMMGGGSPNFLPKSKPGSKRSDDVDYIELFRRADYRLATTKAEMFAAAEDSRTTKLLGLYNTGNVDGALDLKFLKKGTVSKFPDQPDVPEELRAALKVLSRNKNDFVLMVESARIDKYSHSMDPERAIYDTIMLDDAVKQAKDWAAANGSNTLILVTADHTHPVSVIGTVNDEAPGTEMRNKVDIYADAGFPNYPAPDADGYPDRVDVSRRVRLVFGATPDYYETFRPYLDGENFPTIENA